MTPARSIPADPRAGARGLTEVRIERLLIKRGRCVGVAGRAVNPRTQRPDREVTVRARAVVVSCGAMQTPILLRRHGVGGRQMGRNLLVHPNAMVASGVLVEDSTSGTVRRGPLGMPVAKYQITPHDHRRFLKGVRLLAEMHLVNGAEEVVLPFSNFESATTVDELKKIETTQRSASTLELLTVHLMGTSRMGARPWDSSVDLEGQLWDLPGCYVADASIFPSAIGVNPQITIMAPATRVGRWLAERLLFEKARARRDARAATPALRAAITAAAMGG